MFTDCQKELIVQTKLDLKMAGVQVCSALVYDNWLYVMNLGKSKCLICYTDGRFSELTQDHILMRQDEAQRITSSANGLVANKDNNQVHNPLKIWNKKDMLQPGLEITRCLGALSYTDCGVVSMPEISATEID